MHVWPCMCLPYIPVYMEKYMVKEQEHKQIFLCLPFPFVSLANVLDKNMGPVPNFLAFYNIFQCTTGIPSCNIPNYNITCLPLNLFSWLHPIHFFLISLPAFIRIDSL